jgi:hypothetical protein
MMWFFTLDGTRPSLVRLFGKVLLHIIELNDNLFCNILVSTLRRTNSSQPLIEFGVPVTLFVLRMA